MIINRDVCTLGHDSRTDSISVQSTAVRRSCESFREKPCKDAGHDETNNNQAQDHDEASIEDELGSKAARRDLVNVAGIVTLLEAGDGRLEITSAVKEASAVFAA